MVVARAAYLQLVTDDFYQQQGDARFLREMPIATSRGMITDRNGEPLAMSVAGGIDLGNPEGIAAGRQRLPELAKALGHAAWTS